MGRFAAAAGPRGRTKDLEALAQRPTTRASVLAIPLVVPVGMRVLFPMLARRLGARRGYLAGFAVYWAGCYLVPLALLGRHRIVALLREPADPLPRPGWLAAAALLVPPLGAAGTELLPALGQADPVLAGTAGALVGIGFGWVAWRTRSLRWTLPAHVATDASGLPAARFWLNRTR